MKSPLHIAPVFLCSISGLVACSAVSEVQQQLRCADWTSEIDRQGGHGRNWSNRHPPDRTCAARARPILRFGMDLQVNGKIWA
jgi:hypothetical protein